MYLIWKIGVHATRAEASSSGKYFAIVYMSFLAYSDTTQYRNIESSSWLERGLRNMKRGQDGATT